MDNKNRDIQKNIDIDELAAVSRVALSAEERLSIEADICEFLALADCLHNYPAEDEAEGAILLSELREDVAAGSELAADITRSAPNFEGGFFCAPRSVEGCDK